MHLWKKQKTFFFKQMFLICLRVIWIVEIFNYGDKINYKESIRDTAIVAALINTWGIPMRPVSKRRHLRLFLAKTIRL